MIYSRTQFNVTKKVNFTKIKVKKVSINAQRSYAIVNAENVSQKYHAANITFEFRTSKQNGLLMYSTANGEYSCLFFIV